MARKIERYIALGVFMAVCSTVTVGAREFRAPLMVGHVGHDFDPCEKSPWYIMADVDWYSRSAHRAFASHGVATGELSTLFFNADSFRLSHIFEHCAVAQNTEHYNPYMRIMKIDPRVEYYENGMCLSANVSRSVMGGKARWGVRVKVPVRAVDTVRKDIASRRDSQTEDVAKFQKNEAASSSLGFAYRLDFLEAMPTNDFSASQVDYAAVSGPDTYISIFGGTTLSGKAAAIYSPEGYVPRGTRVGILASTALSATPISTTLESLDEDTIYALGTGDFSALTEASAANTPTRVKNQDKKATVWISSTHNSDGSQVSSGATNTINARMKDMVSTFNANTYEWLNDRGYVLETTRQLGLGDIDLELYYDYYFGDRIVGGLSALLRTPTACGSGSDEANYTGNPYRSHTGNGRHVEIGGGMHFDVETRSWMMMHFDTEYRFALARAEKTCGTPAESLIKNMGSEQLADVSWHSVIANADMHFCHSHTTDITGFVGYQFYWKRQDTVRFRSGTVDSWLGAFYDPTDGVKDYAIENTIALDNNLAAANTEQFAHRIKGGITYHLSDWFSLRAGGAITFAGQNIPKEVDMYAGCLVAF
ncbi:MAG: hypothetical protein QG604_536 [Candidatus Dependentiae bacterium]|nr:hypothetical protein [Candidatus Dependentiae bacterium]